MPAAVSTMPSQWIALAAHSGIGAKVLRRSRWPIAAQR